MEYVDKEIPKIIEKREYHPDGANYPTTLAVHECFCGKGRIEHHYISGFDDEYYLIRCPRCKRKYTDIIDRIGYEWRVYLK